VGKIGFCCAWRWLPNHLDIVLSSQTGSLRWNDPHHQSGRTALSARNKRVGLQKGNNQDLNMVTNEPGLAQLKNPWNTAEVRGFPYIPA
jgi:hypothetical protein